MLRFINVCALFIGLPGVIVAGTVPSEIPMRGAAVHQRFLPGGASVVTTADDRVCLASRRIDIAASEYRAADGATVAFDDVIRSPATVIQAIAGADGVAGGAVSFRIQLKFSPRPGAPIMLEMAGVARDIGALLEPSGDSLLIAGALADDLAAAFDAGARPVLRSLSRDTGHTVTDHIDAPDLAALAACADTLVAPQEDGGADSPSMIVRAVFDAPQSPEAIATPGQLQACGMPDRPETLYLGHLRSLSGFVAHTDKVFVSFNAQGGVERAYIPGIFDADLRPGQGGLRVSRSADGNVPGVRNQVSGCIGAETMAACPTDLGGGAYALTACVADVPESFLSSRGIEPAPYPRALIPNPPPGFIIPPRGRFGPPGGGGGFGGGGGGSTPITETMPPPDDTILVDLKSYTSMSGQSSPPPPTVPTVPLPAALWLILSALAGLAALGRGRRARNTRYPVTDTAFAPLRWRR
ncbi:hypothetical protein ABIE69_000818 [Rhodobacteraceae bacterium MBR-64]